MTALGIGIRTCRLKAYDIYFFNISEEEAESFAILYENLDIWNIDKKKETNIPLIEKRVRYLHFLFIPVFTFGIEQGDCIQNNSLVKPVIY